MNPFRPRISALMLFALGFAAISAAPAGATYHGRNGRIAWAEWNPGGGGGGGFASLTTYNSRGRAARQLGYCPEDDTGNVCSNWYDVTYSPDGTQLLWDQPDSSGKRVIMLAGADATHPVAIDHETTDDTQARFSPNGRRIVYVQQPTGGGGSNGTIVTSDLTGSGVVVVSPTVRGSAPQFALTGRRILFLRSSGGIWSMGTRGQSPRRLVARAVAFDVAPGGRSIAYQTARGDLYTARSDGSHVRRLVHEPVSDLPSPAVAFSPDGRMIAFSAFGHTHNSGATIFLIPASGGRARVLKDSMDPRTQTTGLAWQPQP